MYYEEKLINGVMMYRGTPDGPWEPLDHAELSRRLIAKDAEIDNFKVLFGEAAAYLETNSLTSIGCGSIFHTLFSEYSK